MVAADAEGGRRMGGVRLVTLSTFPVVVPFLFVNDAVTALRASHGTALAMLLLIGAAFWREAGARPWRTGLARSGGSTPCSRSRTPP